MPPWGRLARRTCAVFGGIGVYAYVCRSPPELPQVHCADTERNRSIIAQCPVLTQPFEPTWWLSNKHLQSTAYVVVCAMARVDWAKVEPLATEDGGTVRLCWAEPPDEADARPTVLLLHGLTGNTRHLGPHIPKLMAAGFRVVGLDRRGHGHPLTSPKFSVFGDGRDVQLAVEAVHRQLPRSPIALLSLCAGGGPMLHYSVLEYERTKKAARAAGGSPVKACLALAPALDLPKAMHKFHYWYNMYFLMRLKKVFLRLNEAMLRHHPAYDRCMNASTFEEYIQEHVPFTGCSSYAEYLQRYNFWQYMEACTALKWDSLVLSAYNDPICSRKSIDGFMKRVDDAPHLMYVMTETGSHVGWYESRGWSQPLYCWLDDVMIQWLTAVMKPNAVAS